MAPSTDSQPYAGPERRRDALPAQGSSGEPAVSPEGNPAEESGRDSEPRFRLASEALAAFLYEWEPAANRVTWFGGLEVVVGFGLDEVEPDVDWWVRRIHPDDVDRSVQLGRAALEGDAAGYSMEYRVLHRDGHYITVDDRSRIVRDAHGRAVRVLGGISDISERKRSEEALREVTRHLEGLDW